MSPSLPLSVGSPRAIAISAAISLGLAFSTVSGKLLRPLLLDGLPGGLWKAVPYLLPMLVTLADILAMVLLLVVVTRLSLRSLPAHTGLSAAPDAPLRWSLVWLLPALLVCVILADPVSDIRLPRLLWLGVGSPIAEELLYRGLAVGVLVRVCGWHWLPACLWPALFFGLAHLGQGSDAAAIAGIVAITGAGGLLFGWLFLRWRFNLWPPVLLHVGLNTLWELFALGEDALGGWLGNLLRLGVVILAIVATLRMAPRRAAAK